MEMLQDIAKALETGDAEKLKFLTRQALNEGIPARTILEDGLFAAMDVVGKRFKEGELFLPEVLLCARAMNQTLEILKPHLAAGDVIRTEKVLLGTVKGDLHDIGKNIVAIMVRGAGYQVIDLGTDVPTEKFVAAVKEHKPIALGLSALLTTTMLGMKDVIDSLKQVGLRDKIKILVGGAPVTQQFADEIGADGYSDNAYGAVALLKGSKET